MKIRILSNTIRFRLKEPEVIRFQQSGQVMEILQFGPGTSDQLVFALEIASVQQLGASFQPNRITVQVPKMLAEKWAGSDLVGFNGKVDTGKGKTVQVLIEKDFMCMEGREEDKVGSYPNPLMHPGL